MLKADYSANEPYNVKPSSTKFHCLFVLFTIYICITTVFYLSSSSQPVVNKTARNLSFKQLKTAITGLNFFFTFFHLLYLLLFTVNFGDK